jgi:hypothetical protein
VNLSLIRNDVLYTEDHYLDELPGKGSRAWGVDRVATSRARYCPVPFVGVERRGAGKEGGGAVGLRMRHRVTAEAVG